MKSLLKGPFHFFGWCSCHLVTDSILGRLCISHLMATIFKHTASEQCVLLHQSALPLFCVPLLLFEKVTLI